MFGAKAVEEVRQQKQALVMESSLNRLKLTAELHNLRTATSPLGGLAGGTQKLFPLLMVLAPVAGYFAARTLRRSDSVPGRLASAVKLILPLYELWQRFSSARSRRPRASEADDSAGAPE